MASTIKLKNGSGAPLASDLVQGEPALDLTNKRLYTEDSLGAVIEVGTNPTSLTTGDITATGTTTITTADINGGAIDGTTIGGTTTAAGSFTTLQADTSLNVDGTVTADGLTVDSSSSVISTFNGTAATGVNVSIKNTEHEFYIGTNDGNLYLYDVDNTATRFNIASNGDISFYEDTGTTAKFFWDASAESLGIGITTPTEALTVVNGTNTTVAQFGGTSGGADPRGLTISTFTSAGGGDCGVDFNAAVNNTGYGAFTFSAGTNERMRITDTGNVGIARTPSYRLDMNSSTGVAFRVVETTTGNTGRFQAGVDSGLAFIEAEAGSGSIGLGFKISNSEKMRIDSSGNVGVNVTPPSDMYSGVKTIQLGHEGGGIFTANTIANGTVSIGLNNYFNSSLQSVYATSNAASQYAQVGGEHRWRTAPSGTAGAAISFTEAMTLDASGNLGIGATPSGWTQFDVIQMSNGANLASYTAGTGQTHLGYNNYWNGSNYKYVVSDEASRYIQVSGEHRWETAPSGTAGNNITFSRGMTLDASGNLLVGDTSSSFPTNVRAIKLFEANMGINHSTTNNSGDSYIRFGYSTNTIGSITQSGTTAVAYNTTSDERLKQNIQDADSAGSVIDDIQVRQYDWIADGEHQRYGMIAQELNTVAPEAVTQGETDDDMWAVDYSKLVPILVKEIQDLRKRVADLEGN